MREPLDPRVRFEHDFLMRGAKDNLLSRIGEEVESAPSLRWRGLYVQMPGDKPLFARQIGRRQAQHMASRRRRIGVGVARSYDDVVQNERAPSSNTAPITDRKYGTAL